ncbi:hypothetical protein HMPREF0433_01871 [Gemella sanguinis M325]|nr:hypothetical protein HMPREF0433_01871 [Gemella sanguinis M325]
MNSLHTSLTQLLKKLEDKEVLKKEKQILINLRLKS